MPAAQLIPAILAAALALFLLWKIVTLAVSIEGRFEGGTHLAGEWELTLHAGRLAVARIRERGAAGPSTQIRFGRRRWTSRAAAGPTGEPPLSEEAGAGEASGFVQKIGRVLKILLWVDRRWGVARILSFLVRERRRVAIGYLAGKLRFGFEDYARTGEVLGYAWAVRSVLGPPALAFEPIADWSGRNLAAGKLSGSLRILPVLLILDALWFLATRFRISPSAEFGRRAPREARGQ